VISSLDCYQFLLVEGVRVICRWWPTVQDPVYYAALVSWGGWCKATVSFLLPPLNPLEYRQRSRAPAG